MARNFLKVLEELKKITINSKYDIPYFAGYDWSGKKVYIDRDIPKFIKIKNKKINLHESLAVHEFVEKKLINKGYTYTGAHRIATAYERQYVKSKGISWKDYDRKIGKLIQINFISKIRSLPKDLDMTPYSYSRDTKTLTKMRKLLI
jgi:hypothetical protein